MKKRNLVFLFVLLLPALACGLGSGGEGGDDGVPPYGIDQRPMPGGEDPEQLLPAQVGRFSREELQFLGDPVGDPVYATYRDGSDSVFVEMGILASAEEAQLGLETAAGDTTDEFPSDPRFGAIGQEPSYLKVVDDGFFFAWTRGRYYFSAHAAGGEADLDEFMAAFPY
ncbi:MAG: hypothetical protein L0332_18715 [Chloroflexi bacterium]|nr:hypothetical protein [Chloroflexota bacterium]MCI0579965.1 hypothetical protein [Chloroflexota bacterium]MCI0647503.1 hypothetical protein [Chloroflexota bacterium]MCI0728730.1 hypothetical protein [Chloroflexota bacterium]